MPEIGVTDAVEKIVSKAAPAQTTDEKPEAKAPAEGTPVEKADSSQAPADKTAAENEEMSTFEQELIEEFKDEYESAGDKKAFLNALKRTYRKQAKQMTELGQLRKAVNALKAAGITNDDLMELMSQKRNGKSSQSTPSNGNGEMKRGFQRYLAESTDPAERENLTKAEQVIEEKMEDFLSKWHDKNVKPLQEKLDAYEQKERSARASTLEKEINDLEDKHGFKGSLVETYRDSMLNLGLKYPNYSARKLLQMVATEDEYDNGRIQKGSDKEDGRPSNKPAANVVKKSSPVQMPRDNRGRVSINSALDLLFKPKR